MGTVNRKNKSKLFALVMAFALFFSFALTAIIGVLAERADLFFDDGVSSVSEDTDWTGGINSPGANRDIDLSNATIAKEVDGSTYTYYMSPCQVVSDIFRVKIGRYMWDPLPSADIVNLLQEYTLESAATQNFKFYTRITGSTEGTLFYEMPDSSAAKWGSLKFIFYVRGSTSAFHEDAPKPTDMKNREFVMDKVSIPINASTIATNPSSSGGSIRILAGSISYPVAVDASPYSINDIGLVFAKKLDKGKITYDEGSASVSVVMRSSYYRSFGVELLVVNAQNYTNLITCYINQPIDSTSNKGKGQGQTTRVEIRTSVTADAIVDKYNEKSKMYEAGVSGMTMSNIQSSKPVTYVEGKDNYYHKIDTSNFKTGWVVTNATVNSEAGSTSRYSANTTIAPNPSSGTGKYRESSFDMILQQNTQNRRIMTAERKLRCSVHSSAIISAPSTSTTSVPHYTYANSTGCAFAYDNYAYVSGNTTYYRKKCQTPSHSNWSNYTYYATNHSTFYGSTTEYGGLHYQSGCNYSIVINPTYGEDGFVNTNTVPFYFSTDTSPIIIESKGDSSVNVEEIKSATRYTYELDDFVVDTDGVEFDSIYAYDKAYMSVGLFKKGDKPHILVAGLKNTEAESPKYLVVSVSKKVTSGNTTKTYRRLVSMRMEISNIGSTTNPILKTNQPPVMRESTDGLNPISAAKLKSLTSFEGVRYPTSESYVYKASKSFHVGQSYVDGQYSIDEDSIAEDYDHTDTLTFSQNLNDILFDDEVGTTNRVAKEYIRVSYATLDNRQTIILTLLEVREKTTYYLKVYDSPYEDFALIPIQVTCYDYAPEFSTSFVNSYKSNATNPTIMYIHQTDVDASRQQFSGEITIVPGSEKSNYAGISVLPKEHEGNESYRETIDGTTNGQTKLIFNESLGSIISDKDNIDSSEEPTAKNRDKLTISVKDPTSHSDIFNVVYPEHLRIPSESNGKSWPGAQTVLLYAKKCVVRRPVTFILHDGYANTHYADKLDANGQVATGGYMNGRDVEITILVTVVNTPVRAKYNSMDSILAHEEAQIRMTVGDKPLAIDGDRLGFDFDDYGVAIEDYACMVVTTQLGNDDEKGIGEWDTPIGNWGSPGYIKSDNATGFIACEVKDGILYVTALAKTEGLQNNYEGRSRGGGDFGLLIKIRDKLPDMSKANDPTNFYDSYIWVVMDVRIYNSAPVVEKNIADKNGSSGDTIVLNVSELASDVDMKTLTTWNGQSYTSYDADKLYIGISPTNSNFPNETQRVSAAINALNSMNSRATEFLTFSFPANEYNLNRLIITLNKYSGTEALTILIPVYDTGGYNSAGDRLVPRSTISGDTGEEKMPSVKIKIENSAPLNRPRANGARALGTEDNPALIYLNADQKSNISFTDSTIRQFKDTRTPSGNQFTFAANTTVNNTFRVSPYDLVSDADLRDDLKAMVRTIDNTAWTPASGLNSYPAIKDEDYAKYTNIQPYTNAFYGTPVEPLQVGMDYLQFTQFDYSGSNNLNDGYTPVTGNNYVRAKSLVEGDVPAGMGGILDFINISVPTPSCIVFQGKSRTYDGPIPDGKILVKALVTDSFGEDFIEIYFTIHVLNSKPIQNKTATPGFYGNDHVKLQVNPDDPTTFSESIKTKPDDAKAPTSYPQQYIIRTDSELVPTMGKFVSDIDRDSGGKTDVLQFHSSDFITVKNKLGENNYNEPTDPSETNNIIKTAHIGAVAYQASELTITALKSTYNVSNPNAGTGEANLPWHNCLWLGFKVYDNYTVSQVSSYIWILIEVVNSAPVILTEYRTYTINQDVAKEPMTLAIAGTDKPIVYSPTMNSNFQDDDSRTFSTKSTVSPLLVPFKDPDGTSVMLGYYDDDGINGVAPNTAVSQDQRDGDNFGITDMGVIEASGVNGAVSITGTPDWFVVLTLITNSKTVVIDFAVTDGSKVVKLSIEFNMVNTPLDYFKNPASQNIQVQTDEDGGANQRLTYGEVNRVDLYDWIRPANENGEAAEGEAFVRLVQNNIISNLDALAPLRDIPNTDKDYPYEQSTGYMKAKNSSIYVEPLDAKYIHIYGGGLKAGANNQADKGRYIYIRGLQRTTKPINIIIKYHVWDGTTFGSATGDPKVHSLTVPIMVINSSISEGTTQELTMKVSDEPRRISTQTQTEFSDVTAKLQITDKDRLDKHYINASSLFQDNKGAEGSRPIEPDKYNNEKDSNIEYNNLDLNGESYEEYFDILFKKADGTFTTLTKNMFVGSSDDYINSGKRIYDSTELYIKPKKKTDVIGGGAFTLSFLVYDDYNDVSQRLSQDGYLRDNETDIVEDKRSDKIIDQEQLFKGKYAFTRTAVYNEADNTFKEWSDSSTQPSMSYWISRRIMTVKIIIQNETISSRQSTYSTTMGLGKNEKATFYLANLIKDSDMVVFHFANSTCRCSNCRQTTPTISIGERVEGYSQREIVEKQPDGSTTSTYVDDYSARNYIDFKPLKGKDILHSLEFNTDANSLNTITYDYEPTGYVQDSQTIRKEGDKYIFTNHNTTESYIDVEIANFRYIQGNPYFSNKTDDKDIYSGTFQTISFSFMRRPSLSQTYDIRLFDGYDVGNAHGSGARVGFSFSFRNKAPIQLMADLDETSFGSLTLEEVYANDSYATLIELKVGQSIQFNLKPTAEQESNYVYNKRYVRDYIGVEEKRVSIGSQIFEADSFRGYLRPAMDFETQYIYNESAQKITASGQKPQFLAEIENTPLYFPEMDNEFDTFKEKYANNLAITERAKATGSSNYTSFTVQAVGTNADGSLVKFTFLVSDDGKSNYSTYCTYYFRIISTPPVIKEGVDVLMDADSQGKNVVKNVIGIKLNDTKDININDFVKDSDNNNETDVEKQIDRLSVLEAPLSFDLKDQNPGMQPTCFNNYMSSRRPAKDSEDRPTYGVDAIYSARSPFLLGIMSEGTESDPTRRYVYQNSVQNNYFTITLSNSNTISITANRLFDESIMKDSEAAKLGEFRLVFYVVDKSNCGVRVELRFTIIHEDIVGKNASTNYVSKSIDAAGAQNNTITSIQLADYFKGVESGGIDRDLNDPNMQYTVEVFEGPRNFAVSDSDGSIANEYNIEELPVVDINNPTKVREHFGTGTNAQGNPAYNPLASFQAYGTYNYYQPIDPSHLFYNYFQIHQSQGLPSGKTLNLVALKRTPMDKDGMKLVIILTKKIFSIDSVTGEITITDKSIILRLMIEVENSAPVVLEENAIGTDMHPTNGLTSTIVLTAVGDTEDQEILALKTKRVKLYDYVNPSLTSPLMSDPDGDQLYVNLNEITLTTPNADFYESGKDNVALDISYDESTQELVFKANRKTAVTKHQATYTLAIPVYDRVEDTTLKGKTILYIPITIANSRPVVKQTSFTFTLYTDESGDLAGIGSPGTRDGETLVHISDLIDDDDLTYTPGQETYTFDDPTFNSIFTQADGLKLYNTKISYDCIVHITTSLDQKTFIFMAKSVLRGATSKSISTRVRDSSGDESVDTIKFNFVIGNSAPKAATPQPNINVVGGLRETENGTEPREYPVFLNEADHTTYFRGKQTQEEKDAGKAIPQYVKKASDINGDVLRFSSIYEDFQLVNKAAYRATTVANEDGETEEEIDYAKETDIEREERLASMNPIVEVLEFQEEGYQNKAFVLRPSADYFGVVEMTVRLYDDDPSSQTVRYTDVKVTINVGMDPTLVAQEDIKVFPMYNRKTAKVEPKNFYVKDYMISGYEFVADTMCVLDASGNEKDPKAEDQNATILIVRDESNQELIKAMRAGTATIRVTLRIGYDDFRMDYTIQVDPNEKPTAKTDMIKTIKENLIDDNAWGIGRLYHVEYVSELFEDKEGDELKLVSVKSSHKMIVEAKIGRDENGNPVKLVLLCYASGVAELTITVQDDIAAYDYVFQYVNDDLEPLSFFASLVSEVQSNIRLYGIGLLIIIIVALVVISRIKAIMRKRKLRANMQALLAHEMEMEQQYLQLAQQQSMYNMLPPSASLQNNMMLGAAGFDMSANNMMLDAGGGMQSNNMLLGGGGTDFDMGGSTQMLQLGAGMDSQGDMYN